MSNSLFHDKLFFFLKFEFCISCAALYIINAMSVEKMLEQFVTYVVLRANIKH